MPGRILEEGKAGRRRQTHMDTCTRIRTMTCDMTHPCPRQPERAIRVQEPISHTCMADRGTGRFSFWEPQVPDISFVNHRLRPPRDRTPLAYSSRGSRIEPRKYSTSTFYVRVGGPGTGLGRRGRGSRLILHLSLGRTIHTDRRIMVSETPGDIHMLLIFSVTVYSSPSDHGTARRTGRDLACARGSPP